MAGHDVSTCPKCGALITPQLSRCRQCGTYLHGSSLEGLIFEKLLPERFAAAPGTGLLILMLGLFFVLMVVGAGPSSLLSMSSYSMREFGALDSPGIFLGEYWRFITSALGHAGIVHIGFNLYALSIAGPVVEQLFDRKRMVILFLIAGALSMVSSYVFATLIMGGVRHLSIGASGAISGLIGAGWMGARRVPQGAPIAQALLRWTGLMLIMGLALPGVDNAAHIGGWVVGALAGKLLPLGLPRSVAENRILSAILLGCLAVNLLCVGLMLNYARGFPGSLAEDAQPKSIFGMSLVAGTPWDESSQIQLTRACSPLALAEDVTRGALARELLAYENTPKERKEAIHRCELAARALPYGPTYSTLSALYMLDDQVAKAKRVAALGRRMMR